MLRDVISDQFGPSLVEPAHLLRLMSIPFASFCLLYILIKCIRILYGREC